VDLLIFLDQKNASLPILAATLLIDQKIILENVPIVKDILTMANLLETLGKKIKINKNRPTAWGPLMSGLKAQETMMD